MYVIAATATAYFLENKILGNKTSTSFLDHCETLLVSKTLVFTIKYGLSSRIPSLMNAQTN